MDETLVIISEYNPFHFGHLYHLQESCKNISANYKIAIISGNFVQRGEPSIINKWEKAKIALQNGFDLVIELPCIYAISSAENFAYGAIQIINQIKPNYLSFGSEDGNIQNLYNLTKLISENQKTYDSEVKKKLSKGFSYPKSQELAINELFNSNFNKICSPNNILGLEYLKALNKTNSTIIPLTVKRNTQFSSSSYIRSLLRKSIKSDLAQYIPENCNTILQKNIELGQYVLYLKKYEKEIIYTIRRMSIADLKNIPDISDNLISKIKSSADCCNTLTELIKLIKNKSITQARIQRILLYILLGITKKDMQISKSTIPYIRILGFNNKGKKIISKISKQSPNVITSLKNFETNCKNQNLLRLLEIDKLATDIYTLAYKHGSKSHLDYTTKIVEI